MRAVRSSNNRFHPSERNCGQRQRNEEMGDPISPFGHRRAAVAEGVVDACWTGVALGLGALARYED